jgi:hypothetical protein
MNIFPNMPTKILFDYCERENINIRNDLPKLKKHVSMLSAEANKFHPLIGSCTKITIDNIDWEFMESLGKNETKQFD